MTEKRPKRPRDLNQWARHMVDLVTGTGEPPIPPPEEEAKDPAAVSLGRRGGLKGGRARAEKLDKERRSEIARQAAKARWKKR